MTLWQAAGRAMGARGHGTPLRTLACLLSTGLERGEVTRGSAREGCLCST